MPGDHIFLTLFWIDLCSEALSYFENPLQAGKTVLDPLYFLQILLKTRIPFLAHFSPSISHEIYLKEMADNTLDILPGNLHCQIYQLSIFSRFHATLSDSFAKLSATR